MLSIVCVVRVSLTLKVSLSQYASFGNILGAGSFLAKTPVVAQAAMNPVALHLIETYLGVDSIHYCHSPGITILRPAEKTENTEVMPGGWHSNRPRHSCAPGPWVALVSRAATFAHRRLPLPGDMRPEDRQGCAGDTHVAGRVRRPRRSGLQGCAGLAEPQDAARLPVHYRADRLHADDGRDVRDDTRSRLKSVAVSLT